MKLKNSFPLFRIMRRRLLQKEKALRRKTEELKLQIVSLDRDAEAAKQAVEEAEAA